MDNYNIDKPELEFGCFTDKQIRLMIALVENNQNEDGSITIPNILKKYMNNQDKI